MHYIYLVPPAAVLLLAIAFRPELLLMFVFTGLMLLAILAGIYLFVASHISENSANNRRVSVKRTQPRLEVMKKCLIELGPKLNRTKRLPVVFGRMLDDAVQQLIDLTLQEAIGNWLNANSLSSEEVVLAMKEDVWKMVQNLQERLALVDLVKLIADNMITKVTLHFEHIRLAQRNSQQKFEKPLYLINEEAEINYLKCIAELILSLLLPKPYLEVIPVMHLLKEILVMKVVFPAIATVTDPDYINQKILLYVHRSETNEPQRRKSYTYAASFEDFILMIKDSKDVEVLNQLRSSIMNEILHASTLQSKKKNKGSSTTNNEVFDHGIARGDFLQGRQVQRYIHQLTYAKSQCEKKLAALGFDGCGVEEAVEATDLSGRKILQLETLLETPLCRQFLTEFLDQTSDKLLLKCWEAIEDLKKANRSDWHQMAADIFYRYINNPSPAVSVEKPVLKRMEQFLLGDQGPEVFFEVQENISHSLEEKIYPAFLVSDVYQRMEVELDQVLDAEPAEEVCLPDAVDLPNSIVEESSYAHKKLDEIQKKLDNKTQALEALRCNMKPDHSVLSRLESDVEALQGEKRQLEAHLVRTEAWSEHLGQWRTVVQSVELSEEKENLQFVLVVHVIEDESDSEAVSTGWVVLRRLSELQDLHRKLCQLSSKMKHFELPSQQSFKFQFRKSAMERALEKAKQQIQKYLQFVLEDDILNKSEAVYAFLSPSSEHLKQTMPSPQKPKFAFSTLLKNPLQLVEGLTSIGDNHTDGTTLDSVEENVLLLLDENDGRAGSVGESAGKDGVAEPLYDLLSEIFDLRGVFMWLRKTLITFVQITYNKTISRQVRETVTGLFSEHMVYSYIQFIINAWWVDGKLKEPPPARTLEEKTKTRSEARDHFLANIPELLTHLVGQQACRRGATKVFDTLQDPVLNKQLFYELLEVVLQEMFPERNK